MLAVLTNIFIGVKDKLESVNENPSDYDSDDDPDLSSSHCD